MTEVASISVAPATSTFNALGDTVLLTARAINSYGAILRGVPVTWSVDAPLVAALSSPAGPQTILTTLGNGTARVTATAGGRQTTVTITVHQTFALVHLTPACFVMENGSSFPIKADLADSNGHALVIPNMPPATFGVADTTIARVDANGVLSAKQPGNTTLSVGMTWNGITRIARGTVAVSAYRVVDTVTMTAQTFRPDSLDIGRWGAVVFLNSSGVIHNVTFTSTTPAPPGNIPDNANALDARVFTEPGRYTYQCTHHPGMTGVIRVH